MTLPDLRDSSVTFVANIPVATTDAREFFASCRALIDSELDRLLPKETDEPTRLHSAIRWSVFAGGKRFRPALLLATGQALGASVDDLIRSACALEMIHTYSLIHDDLPSMDDDDLRRGRPTCHVKFGEATAILAGDALQTLAFQTIAEDERLASELRVKLIAEVARAAATPEGMVAGQALDLGEPRIDGGHRHALGAPGQDGHVRPAPHLPAALPGRDTGRRFAGRVCRPVVGVLVPRVGPCRRGDAGGRWAVFRFLRPLGRIPRRTALSNSSSVHAPMPVSRSGVMFGATMLPNGVSMARPPANGLPVSGTV